MNAEKIITELRGRLLSQRGKYAAIAKMSGLSVSWLSKFATGTKDDPKLKTLVALDGALGELEKSRLDQPNENQQAA